MYKFGRKSAQRRDECVSALRRVLDRALAYGVMDMSIICGARLTDEQKQAFAQGRSKLDGVTKFSKHQVGGNTGRDLSEAVDVVPYPIDWDNKLAFHVMAGLMFAAAAEEGVKLSVGS